MSAQITYAINDEKHRNISIKYVHLKIEKITPASSETVITFSPSSNFCKYALSKR
jgi:hypothetical protein